MAYTKQNTRVVRFSIETEFDAAGAALKVPAAAYLQTRRLVNDADPTDVVEPPWKEVRFDLIDPAIANVNITAATKTVSYQQLAALLRQASLDRATAQGVT